MTHAPPDDRRRARGHPPGTIDDRRSTRHGTQLFTHLVLALSYRRGPMQVSQVCATEAARTIDIDVSSRNRPAVGPSRATRAS